MFLHRRGARVYLLHSYRDGSGAVRQRRLAHLEGREQLEEKLADWERWQWETRRAYPSVRGDWQRLREQAERIVQTPDWPRVRANRATAEGVRRALRQLLSALNQQPQMTEEVLEEIAARLDKPGGASPQQQRLRSARQQLPARRRSFHPSDPQARAYLQALDEAVETLRQEGETEEACRLAEERVSAAPTPEARLALGELLHLTGRAEEALEQYRRVPYRNAWRYFHSAALHHREGRLEEAFQDVLRGLTRDRNVGAGARHVVEGRLPWWHVPRQYWERYGHLWTPEATRFLHAIYSQAAVRTRLTQAGHEGVLKRSLLPDYAHQRVWRKVTEEARPCRMRRANGSLTRVQDPFRTLTGPLALLTLAALAGTAWELHGAGPAPPILLPALALVLILQVGARALPVWGVSCADWSVVLAFQAVYPGRASLLYAGLLLRTALLGCPSPNGRWAELVSDWVALLACGQVFRLAQASAIPAPLAVLATVMVWLTLTEGFAGWVTGALDAERRQGWKQGREGGGGRVLAAGLGGAALTLLWPSGWWCLAFAGPLLFVQRSLLNRHQVAPREAVQALEQRLHGQLARADQLAHELEGTKRALSVKLEERTLLEELAEGVAREPGLEGTARLFLRTLPRLLPCSTAVLFLAGPDGLEPAYFQSEQGDALTATRLARPNEPILAAAWESGGVQERCDQPGGQLFPDERWAACYPLRGLGLLYVGSRSAWTPDHRSLLALVARQAEPALLAARRFQAQQEALGYHSQAHRQLRQTSQALGTLLARISPLLGALDETVARDSMTALGREIFADCTLALILEPTDLAAAETVMREGTLLQIDDLEHSRFAPLRAGDSCLLAAPIPGPGAPAGALLLGWAGAAASPERVELVQVAAGLFGGIWQNARLRGELVQSYQQLQESQAVAVQSSKMAAVGQLAAGVAHELNNPLGAVLLSIESSLKMADRPQLVTALLSEAVKGVVRSREIVAKLLYYSRDAAAGRKRLDMRALAQDTLAMVRRQLDLDHVQARLEVPEEGCAARVNENELHQVLLNLLLNARDALLESQERSVVVRVGATDAEVFLAVQDGGAGMSPDVLRRATEPFYTTKPVGRGTGLGLSISQQIVEAHEGRLEIQSAPGSGTTVTVWLPRTNEPG